MLLVAASRRLELMRVDDSITVASNEHSERETEEIDDYGTVDPEIRSTNARPVVSVEEVERGACLVDRMSDDVGCGSS
jgi:hypothetical protein